MTTSAAEKPGNVKKIHGAPKQPGYKLSSKYIPLCSAEQKQQILCENKSLEF